jgi:hypothetical protein
MCVIPNNPSRTRKHPVDEGYPIRENGEEFLAVVTIAAIVLWIR